MISRIFIFYAVFYGTIASLVIMLAFALPSNVDPNCADRGAFSKVSPTERPSFLDYIGAAWNFVINVATLGLASRCGIPAAILFAVGAFNLISLTVMSVGMAFLSDYSDRKSSHVS